MRTFPPFLAVICCALIVFPASAATLYVDLNSASPVPPYADWSTAAANIQDAVDAAGGGDLILVTNGIYAAGGRLAAGITTNRVVIDKAVTVQSVNGPGATVIQGFNDPAVPLNTNSVRCVFLTNGAVLSGFTLTNGATRSDGDSDQDQSGGGAWCATTNEIVTNCVVAGNSAAYDGGGVFQGTIDNCVLTGDTASNGGGACGCVANDSTFVNCSAGEGGGALGGTLNRCVLSGNSSGDGGGGVNSCLAINCLFTGNSSFEAGGGAYASTANNCVFTNNYSNAGGGTGFSTVNNSELAGNSAGWGGAAAGGTLNNCTMVANTAGGYGGGGADCTMNNCLVYYNTSPDGNNFKFDGEIYGTMNFCDTTPLPDTGSNNITAEPQLTDFAHVSATSPCLGSGNASYTSGTDIDGDSWRNPPAIGCDEYYAGAIKGALTVTAQADFTNLATGFTANFSGAVFGHAAENVWDFGDGTTVSNRLFVAHNWSAAGDYIVTFTAFNDDNPAGVRTTLMVHVLANPVYYVSLGSVNPVPPYSSWATAATNIQDAVDVAFIGGTVLASNGVYAAGGRVVHGALTNRVAVTKPLILQSANGPDVTWIAGWQVPGTIDDDAAVRCVYLTNGATLAGFTLTNGATRSAGDGTQEQSGGGVWCESANATVTNCVIANNSAAASGGGAYAGTFYQCRFTGNSVGWNPGGGGGAASSSVLNNCVLFGNSAASYAGGVDSCTLTSCVLEQNSGLYGGAAHGSTLTGCLLTNNYAFYVGGGGYGGTFSNCTLVGNISSQGGGACGSELDNCRLLGNCVTNNLTGWDSVMGDGGGANSSTLNNCALAGNTAEDSGGGASGCTLNNCTLTGNVCTNSGGGSDSSCTLNNCIVFYNQAPNGANYSGGTFNNSCTTPLPGGGTNNIIAEPLLADVAHLTAASPCIGAGSTNYSTGVDIDGEPWRNPPSIGCDEFYTGAITGALTVAIQPSYTNVAAGFAVNFTGTISGHASSNVWSFGDGTVVSNELYLTHAWTASGNYPVTFTAFNSDNPGGVAAAVTIFVLVQPVHYVNAAGTSPVAPYLSWATAATNIQDAVDAAFVGGTVLVTNGIYASGGRAVSSALTNRVAVTRPLTVASVNGPAATVIKGNPILSDSAVRSVYLQTGAMLSGFTLKDGATRNAGDAVREQSGGGVWCQDNSIVVSNCWLSGNSAVTGGGAYQGLLENCQLFGNAANNGGGASGGVLNNCALAGNSAMFNGGAAQNCVLNNCTLTANFATDAGGGVDSCTLDNSIVFSNSAATSGNYNNSTLNFCCTTPLPDNGTNNLTADPQLADTTHLKAGSPCIGAGSTNYSTGVDIDGEPWANPPSIGCDEFSAGAPGLLAAEISASFTNVAAGFAVNWLGLIHGHANEFVWDFGDGTSVTNQLRAAHAWTIAGNHAVVLTAFNDDHPGGVSVTSVVSVLAQSVYYVALTGTNPVAPFTSWGTAATDIQSAVDVAAAGSLVLVSNGVYQVGGRLDARTDLSTNRVVVAKPVTVMSVNGPAVTVICGHPIVDPTAVRCIYLTNGAALCGFTLTQGAARNDGDGGQDQPGGGAWCESTGALISNCFLIRNFAMSSGGGAYRGTLNNCVISSNSCTVLWYYGAGAGASAAVLNNCVVAINSASWSGGGADGCTLNNCTLAGNSANFYGNSVNGCTLNNCISYYNNGDNYASSTLNYCCTTPDPGGIGNITNEPAFVNWTNGDFHLQANSPCINSGDNNFVVVTNDLDGHPRVVGGTVDMGAYEFQAPTSILSYAWAAQYGVPTDGSADGLDMDGTGMNNWQKWIAGLNPTNPASVLVLGSPVSTNSSAGIMVTWQSVDNRMYFLQRSSDLAAPTFRTIQSAIAGQAGMTSYADTTATNGGPYFYRVGVQ